MGVVRTAREICGAQAPETREPLILADGKGTYGECATGRGVGYSQSGGRHAAGQQLLRFLEGLGAR